MYYCCVTSFGCSDEDERNRTLEEEVSVSCAMCAMDRVKCSGRGGRGGKWKGRIRSTSFAMAHHKADNGGELRRSWEWILEMILIGSGKCGA